EARQRGGLGNSRWFAAAAIVVAIVLYLVLPTRLLVGPRLVVRVVEVVLLVTLVMIHPRKLDEEARFSRIASIALVLVIAAANLVTLGVVVEALVSSQLHEGRSILIAAFDVWMTNVIVFGVAYWELDRGGPVRRVHGDRKELPPADFRFSQD